MHDFSPVQFFRFTGRLDRYRFAKLSLVVILIQYACVFVMKSDPTLGMVLYALSSLLWLAPMARRLHDFNVSGAWAVLGLIPLVNMLLWLICAFKGSTPGSNRFDSPSP